MAMTKIYLKFTGKLHFEVSSRKALKLDKTDMFSMLYIRLQIMRQQPNAKATCNKKYHHI